MNTKFMQTHLKENVAHCLLGVNAGIRKGR